MVDVDDVADLRLDRLELASELEDQLLAEGRVVTRPHLRRVTFFVRHELASMPASSRMVSGSQGVDVGASSAS